MTPMRIRSISKRILVITVGFFVVAPTLVWALNTIATGYMVGSAEKTIDAYGVCKQMKATNGKEYFVPTKTKSEWNNFLANTPSGISVSDCKTLFTDDVKLVTKFECPGPYDYMQCGAVATSNSITKDGKYIFAFVWGYGGHYGNQKMHVYEYDRDAGSVSKAATLTDFSDSDKPVTNFAIDSDGSRLLLVREPKDRGGSAPFYVYTFNGSSFSRVYSGSRTGGGLAVSAMSENAQQLAFDGRIYEKDGSDYKKVYDNGAYGPANNSQDAKGFLGANLYLGNDTFYVFKRHGLGHIVKKQTNDTWEIVQTISPGESSVDEPSFMAVSPDHSFLAINSKKNYSSNYMTDVYQIKGSGPTYKKIGTIDLGKSDRYTINFSGDGRYLIASGKTWDITPLLNDQSAKVVNSTATWDDDLSLSQWGYVHENELGDFIVAKPSSSLTSGKQHGVFYLYKRIPE